MDDFILSKAYGSFPVRVVLLPVYGLDALGLVTLPQLNLPGLFLLAAIIVVGS